MRHITDNQDELFDIVDEEDRVIGQARREEVHKNKKLIHRSIGVCVFNSKGEIYLQKRSRTKDTDPGKWTISCSGHVATSGFAGRQNFLTRKISSLYSAFLVKADSVIINFSGRLYSWLKHSVCDLRKFHHAVQNLSVYENAAHRELKEELGADLDIEFVEKYLCRASNETEMTALFKAYSEGPFELHPQEIEEGKFFTQKELKEALRKRKIELSFMGKAALTKIGFL